MGRFIPDGPAPGSTGFVRYARQVRFADRIAFAGGADPDHEGRPGERLRVSSLSVPRGIGPDGSREDLRAVTGRSGSFLSVTCLGPEAMLGSPDYFATSAFARICEGYAPLLRPLRCTVAGEAAITYAARMDKGITLTEWVFSHSGWLFVAGVAIHPEDPGRALCYARESLRSWTWTH